MIVAMVGFTWYFQRLTTWMTSWVIWSSSKASNLRAVFVLNLLFYSACKDPQMLHTMDTMTHPRPILSNISTQFRIRFSSCPQVWRKPGLRSLFQNHPQVLSQTSWCTPSVFVLPVCLEVIFRYKKDKACFILQLITDLPAHIAILSLQILRHMLQSKKDPPLYLQRPTLITEVDTCCSYETHCSD